MPNQPSRKYWAEREEYLQNQLLKIGEDYYTSLAKEYDRAAANIQKEIESFYYRFATDNKIDYIDAKRILTSAERKQFQLSLEEYIEKGRTLSYSQEHAKALENASTVYRVSRLQALQLQMQQQVEELTAKYETGLRKGVTDIYTDSYYRNIYELQSGVGVGADFTILDTKTVQNVVAKPWAADGRIFSERIWDDRNKLVDYLNKNVTQAFIRGDAPQKLIKDIQNKFDVSKRNAERLVLTESAYFSSKTTQDSYSEFGVDQFEYLATLDIRTSSLCRDMDGKVFDTKDYQIGVNAPPLHARCRSTTIPYFPPDEFDSMHERAARDDKGKYYTVPADMTYNTWHNKYVKDNATYELFEKKLQNKSSDKALHEKYRQIMPDKVPKSLEAFQEIKYNNTDEWKHLKSTANTKNYLQQQLAYVYNGEKLFIPDKTVFSSTPKVIAGQGSDKPIRVINKLIETQGGNSEQWSKRVASIKSDKYVFDVHWYEKDSIQYEMKLKFRKER